MSSIRFPDDKTLDFVAVGRLCIDLNANEINRPMEDTVTFTKYVGGSPANICIGMARLGMKTGFIGKVAMTRWAGSLSVTWSRTGSIRAMS
ncbi:MAG: 5-dehydro-2-deoxygluconokinase [Paenibacillus sp.]|nr:5-dehydro-2-deoxygluconokinase [Paenibacillus sp.]